MSGASTLRCSDTPAVFSQHALHRWMVGHLPAHDVWNQEGDRQWRFAHCDVPLASSTARQQPTNSTNKEGTEKAAQKMNDEGRHK